jgi:hypothetical protein
MEKHSLAMDAEKAKTTDDNAIVKLLYPGDFPEDSFDGETRKIIDYQRDQFGIPAAATAMCLLGALSAAIGPFVVVSNASEHGDTYLNIWSIIVAAKSSGKSQLLKEITNKIVEANGMMEGSFRMDILPAIEMEIEKQEYIIQQSKHREPSEPDAWRTAIEAKKTIKRLKMIEPPRLIVETATCESLKNTVARAPDHFTFCMSGEGAGVLKVMFGKYDRTKHSEIDAWLSLKTGDYINDTRIGRESVTVCNGRIAMLLMVQPVVAYELMGDREAILRGLLTRMFVFDPHFDRQRAIRHEVPRPTMRIFHGLLGYYLDKRKQFMEENSGMDDPKNDDGRIAWFTERIECGNDAREIFADFHDEGLALEQSLIPIEPALGGECGRWREDAIQIAGLLAALEKGKHIDAALARKATNVVRWCKKSFLAMFLKPYFARIDEKCERMMDAIDGSPDKQAPLRLLRNSHGIGEQDIAGIQAMYPHKFSIGISQLPNGGRPSKVIWENKTGTN